MEDDVKAALRVFFDAVLTAEPLLNELRTEYGLSLAQIRCLFQLRSGDQTAGELAKSLGIRATSLTRMIERLETENWVKRQNDKHDRRRIVLTLTEEAEDMLSHLDFFLDSPAAMGIKRMTPQERVEFTQALQRFLQHVTDTQNLHRD